MEDTRATPTANASGGTITTGVNVADLVAADAARSASSESGGFSGFGGGGDAMYPSPLLSPSFHVYWNDAVEAYMVNNPKVVDPEGNDIDVGGPREFGSGYIFCEIGRSNGEYTATITNERSHASGVIAAVPIAAITSSGVTQYHVGVIVLVGGREYIAGDDTNIVFKPVTDSDDPDAGKVKVDVYYI